VLVVSAKPAAKRFVEEGANVLLVDLDESAFSGNLCAYWQ
jgi:hypothetical protein